MTDDLKAQLRDRKRLRWHPLWIATLCEEAADRIEELEREREKAYAEGYADGMNDRVALRKRAEAAERERDEARAALRWVYENGMQKEPLRPKWVMDAVNDAYDGHRAALTSDQLKDQDDG